MSHADSNLEFNLGDLVDVLGEPTSLSEPDLMRYWFIYGRDDGLTVIVNFSGYDRRVGVIVRASDGVEVSAVGMRNCDVVRVLEAERRTLEVISRDPPARCFLALDGDSVLAVDIPWRSP